MLLARMFFLRKARDHVHDAEPDFLDSLISNSTFSIRLEYALAVNRRKNPYYDAFHAARITPYLKYAQPKNCYHIFWTSPS